MKLTNAEILKRDTTEAIDLKEMLSTAREHVRQEELRASEAEEEARSLELELMQAEAAHEAKEEAEKKGKETTEKIESIAGSG